MGEKEQPSSSKDTSKTTDAFIKNLRKDSQLKAGIKECGSVSGAGS